MGANISSLYRECIRRRGRIGRLQARGRVGKQRHSQGASRRVGLSGVGHGPPLARSLGGGGGRRIATCGRPSGDRSASDFLLSGFHACPRPGRARHPLPRPHSATGVCARVCVLEEEALTPQRPLPPTRCSRHRTRSTQDRQNPCPPGNQTVVGGEGGNRQKTRQIRN